MTESTPTVLLSRYAEHVAPFIRQDDFYGNILLPSLIGNQKGRFRAVVNRRPFFLYKGHALSSPELSISLGRHEEDTLLPLADLLCESSDLRSAIPVSDLLTDEKNRYPLSTAAIVEAVFRFLVVRGDDERAVALVGKAIAAELAGLFLRRCAFLLKAANPVLSVPDDLVESVLSASSLADLIALLDEGPIYGCRMPGEASSLSGLYFRCFEPLSGSVMFDELESHVGDLHLALERRSGELSLLYLFYSLIGTGRLFAAFRLGSRCIRLSSDLNRVSGAFLEEMMRIALINDRIGLFHRLRELHSRGEDEQTLMFRLHYLTGLYGFRRMRAANQLLRMESDITEPAPAVSEDEMLTPVHWRALCGARFEELLLDENRPAWFMLGRRYLALFAGEDFRLRALLGALYESSEPEAALHYYESTERPALLLYRSVLLRRRIDRTDAGKKRESRLRKMLESSLGPRDPGSGTIDEH